MEMMFDGGDPYCSLVDEDHEFLSSPSSPSSKKMKMKMMKNKKRFSDEQIRSLESIFETDSKLEPRKKVQVARELGLQPRQVAIWFQNKRARWKSKQMEKDYDVLRANYNVLASRFETLKEEKQSLLAQLQKLNELVNKAKTSKAEEEEEVQYCKQSPSNINVKTTIEPAITAHEMAASMSGISGSTTTSSSTIDRQFSDEENYNSTITATATTNIYNTNNIVVNNYDSAEVIRPALSLDGSEYGMAILQSSGDGCSDDTNYFGNTLEDETAAELLMAEPAAAAATVASTSIETVEDDWDNLHSDGLFDHSAGNQWLDDFWS